MTQCNGVSDKCTSQGCCPVGRAFPNDNTTPPAQLICVSHPSIVRCLLSSHLLIHVIKYSAPLIQLVTPLPHPPIAIPNIRDTSFLNTVEVQNAIDLYARMG